jgi:3-hydroxyacyl-CoA dehydrogenase/enoyl-CoA hydratase/3-hydroxybutyryl-CoA epimerase
MAKFQTPTLRLEERSEGIVFLRMDVKDRSVNVFNSQLLADFESALDAVAAQTAYRVLVIRSDKPSGFLAGADLQEFDHLRTAAEATAVATRGQALFARLAGLAIPSVAVIHGPCLGGGLECALACDYRIALDQTKTQFGLPEVELGLLPGWGGTQRLPRVIGLERSLQIILGGKRLRAREAGLWGLVDMVAQTEPELSARLALLIVRAMQSGKRNAQRLPLRTWRQRVLESSPLGRAVIFRGTERMLERRVPDDMPAPAAALEAIRTGIRQGFEAGLTYERQAVGRLLPGKACRNLVQLFLERDRLRKPAGGTARELLRLGVVGAGTMGAGIAQLAAIAGMQVVVKEADETARLAGKERLAGLFRKAVENNVLTQGDADRKLAAIRLTTDFDGFEQVDLAIEAVIEDLAQKQTIFQELEQHTSPGAILATNTSSLSVAEIQAGLRDPSRVGGMHFFNPVHKMPLVEIVRSRETSEQTAAHLAAWATALGKTPVVVLNSPGFIVNRILVPYLYEAILLLAEKIPAEVIDSSMRRFGMPMGPLELIDQVGLDVVLHITRALEPFFSKRLGAFPQLQPMSAALEDMVRGGLLGQKAGRGFYVYRGKTKKLNGRALNDTAGRMALPEPSLTAELPRSAQAREAVERMVLAMVNEASACLQEGLTAGAETIDLAMVLGTGWAPHRGGPLRYARDRGVAEIVKALENLAKRLGARFEPHAGLEQLPG